MNRSVVEEMTEAEFDELSRYKRVLDWEAYLHTDPRILAGKPVVRGTRMAVEFILELYAGGLTDEQVLENYPHLTRESIRAVFAYAAECVSEQQVRPVAEQTAPHK